MTSRTDGFEAFVFIDYVDSDGTIETDIEPLFGDDEAASGQLPFTGNYEIVLAVSDGNFEEYPDLTYTLSWMVGDEDEVD